MTVSSGQALPTANLTDYAVARPQDVDTLAWDCPDASDYTTTNVDPNQRFQVSLEWIMEMVGLQ